MKLLIGSNGGISGIYLAKRYRGIEGIEVYGSDASSDNVGRFFVDRQFVLPPSSDSTFIKSLIDLINGEGIDIYLPTHSK